ncbi:MAG TPA: hypothetical protein HA364_01945, partial [Thermoplasmata archaeon]|nr:hypothetical protein [Thermoplasmata archaeon]
MRTTYSKRIIAALLIVTAFSMVNAFTVAKPDSFLEPPADSEGPIAEAEWTIIVYLAANDKLQLAAG